ncbi:helix-turn-helix domain-containing protein [Ochrobactrum sp. XJ1]|nr:helix-turn-helix domain-containing protein [Ochrobactrum sp. XJ1]
MPLDTQICLLPLPDNDETLIPSRRLPLYIGISAQTLARWRHEGKGPSFVKIGRMVAYRTGVIRGWIAAQQRVNTSQ